MAFSDEELERYQRHILLKELGGPGQQKLKSASVLVVGAGGLGAPLLFYLAAAGIGKIGIVDFDHVSLSNLQRQIIFSTANVGELKTEAAAKALKALNPNVNVEIYSQRLTAENAGDLISKYDVIADGSDNFATRYLVSDACFYHKKPLVSAAVGQFDGQISTFKPYLQKSDGTPYPTYRCLHPQAPPDGILPACAEAGVIGALTGVIGSMQALEVIKEIAGIGEGLAGKLLLYDGLSARIFVTSLSWEAHNPLNGTDKL
jgi:adenylyltransferase/sulfurtransferase